MFTEQISDRQINLLYPAPIAINLVIQKKENTAILKQA